MRLSFMNYRRLMRVFVAMCFVGYVSSCAEKREPLGKDGLKCYIFQAVDLGLTFHYDLISYSSKIEKVNGGGGGRISESLHETYVIKVSKEDHNKIVSAVKEKDRWRKRVVLSHDEVKKTYVYMYSNGYIEKSMRSIAEVRDDRSEIEILFYDVDPVIF